jgi:hypothetical protein
MPDTDLLPWSAKAGQLLRDQYDAAGAAARTLTASPGMSASVCPVGSYDNALAESVIGLY